MGNGVMGKKVAIERGPLGRGKVFWSRTKWRVERGIRGGAGGIEIDEAAAEQGRGRGRGGVREGIETSVSVASTYRDRLKNGP